MIRLLKLKLYKAKQTLLYRNALVQNLWYYKSKLLPTRAKPKPFLFISTGAIRSGNVLHILGLHKQVLIEDEAFEKIKIKLPKYIDARLNINYNKKAWGFKVLPQQQNSYEHFNLAQIINEIIKRKGVVFLLDADNRLHQTLSTIILIEKRSNPKISAESPIEISPKRLEDKYYELMADIEMMQTALKGISFLKFTYDNDFASQKAYKNMYSEIFNLLQVNNIDVGKYYEPSKRESYHELISNWHQLESFILQHQELSKYNI